MIYKESILNEFTEVLRNLELYRTDLNAPKDYNPFFFLPVCYFVDKKYIYDVDKEWIKSDPKKEVESYILPHLKSILPQNFYAKEQALVDKYPHVKKLDYSIEYTYLYIIEYKDNDMILGKISPIEKKVTYYLIKNYTELYKNLVINSENNLSLEEIVKREENGDSEKFIKNILNNISIIENPIINKLCQYTIDLAFNYTIENQN